MNKPCLSLAALALLSACSQSAPPRAIESSAMADEFCAGNFTPWRGVLSSCVAEKNVGPGGAQCAFLAQIESELDQRRQASSQKSCQLVVNWRDADSASR